MTVREVFVEAFGRLPELVHRAVAGLSEDQLAARIDPGANTIAWLIWHLARVQDAQIAEIADQEPVWIKAGWAERWQLPFAPSDTGYGHGSAEVGQVRGSAKLLLDYFDAVHDQTTGFLDRMSEGDLDRVLDERWDPPVTVGVRLVSIVGDGFEHGAEANLVRGVLERRERA